MLNGITYIGYSGADVGITPMNNPGGASQERSNSLDMFSMDSLGTVDFDIEECQDNTGNVTIGSKKDQDNDVESCGSLAKNTKSNEPDSTKSESCGSLALSGQNEFKSSKSSSTPQSQNINDTEKQYFGITSQQKQDNITAQNNRESQDTVLQTGQETLQATTALEADGAPENMTGAEAASVNGAETLSSANNLPGGNFAPMGNSAFMNQGQLASAETPDGSWTGSFVKEHTGWSGAYASEATSVGENSENISTSPTVANSNAIGSFGLLTTGMRNNVITIDGMSVPINSMNTAIGADVAAMAGAASNSVSTGGGETGVSAGASSGSSSSSSSSSNAA